MDSSLRGTASSFTSLSAEVDEEGFAMWLVIERENSYTLVQDLIT